MARLIYGVGINDAQYCVMQRNKTDSGKLIYISCKYYKTWKGMLERGYSKKYKGKRLTYKEVTVCEEWLTFSNFKSWMEQQDWEGKQLDKDILFHGNKIYSPETCVFVDKRINTFIIESDSVRGKYPIGVSLDKSQRGLFKYKAMCSNPFTGKLESLGRFKTPEEAHKAWLARKLNLAKELAETIEDKRVADALVKRYENYDQPRVV